MVAGIPNASEQFRIPASTDQLRPVREAVGVIDRLLKLLVTESPPLDIVTVQDVRIGAARVDQGRVVTQTVFDLVAYAAPQEKKPGAPAPAAKPK